MVYDPINDQLHREAKKLKTNISLAVELSTPRKVLRFPVKGNQPIKDFEDKFLISLS